MLGQRADWQTVWSLYLLTTSFTLSYVGPTGSLTFSQGGLSVTAVIPHQYPYEEQKGFVDALVQNRCRKPLNLHNQLYGVAVLDLLATKRHVLGSVL
jgi:hypothetical protein